MKAVVGIGNVGSIRPVKVKRKTNMKFLDLLGVKYLWSNIETKLSGINTNLNNKANSADVYTKTTANNTFAKNGTLANSGITDGITGVSVTGTGEYIASLSKSTDGRTINATKGAIPTYKIVSDGNGGFKLQMNNADVADSSSITFADKVVSKGEVKYGTLTNSTFTEDKAGAQDPSHAYIVFTVANGSPVYVPAAALVQDVAAGNSGINITKGTDGKNRISLVTGTTQGTAYDGKDGADLKAQVDNLISEGGEPNQNAYSTVKVGSVSVAATGKTDTIAIAQGGSVTVSADASTKTITISGTDYSSNILDAKKAGTDAAALFNSQNVKVTTSKFLTADQSATDDTQTLTFVKTGAGASDTFEVGRISKADIDALFS